MTQLSPVFMKPHMSGEICLKNHNTNQLLLLAISEAGLQSVEADAFVSLLLAAYTYNPALKFHIYDTVSVSQPFQNVCVRVHVTLSMFYIR